VSEDIGAGKRRIDRILSAAFTQSLSSLPLAEVRARRDACLAEREYQSLLRRLVQGRLDILRAEATRRGSGGDEPNLVRGVTEALSGEGRTAGTRGEALRLMVPPEEMSLARRRVEGLVADPSISDPRALTDEQLAAAIGRLEREERQVSDQRRLVLDIHDRLQDELKRRYRENPADALVP